MYGEYACMARYAYHIAQDAHIHICKITAGLVRNRYMHIHMHGVPLEHSAYVNI